MAVSLGLVLLIAAALVIVLKLMKSNDDNAMKETTSQANIDVEYRYVNVSSAAANQQQELYCNVNFYSNQVNDVNALLGDSLCNGLDISIATPSARIAASGSVVSVSGSYVMLE